MSALEHEYRTVEAHGLLRCARNLLSCEVTLRRPGPAVRLTLPEVLVDEERVVVLGRKGSGKSALVARLALGTGWQPGLRGTLPFVVPVELMAPGERLDEALLSRLAPAAGRSARRARARRAPRPRARRRARRSPGRAHRAPRIDPCLRARAPGQPLRRDDPAAPHRESRVTTGRSCQASPRRSSWRR